MTTGTGRLIVRVVRSGLVESVHTGHAAVVDPDGGLALGAGDPERIVFARSAMKPLQATVSLSLAGQSFSNAEVAVMCASHNAEPVHIRAVRSLLARGGVSEEWLQCPAVRPWDDEALAADPERRRINSDCSGKHGGMLAACRTREWPRGAYREQDHPLQQHVLETVLQVTGLPEVRVGVDGCGVPVHGFPLRAMATVYAQLAAPTRWGDREPFARRAVQAMAAEPYLVAGRNRVDTALMRAVPGVAVKGGAEGLLCAALPRQGLGVAVKIEDGSSRAAAPALLETLRVLGVLEPSAVEELGPFTHPPVLGGGGRVGQLSAEFEPARA